MLEDKLKEIIVFDSDSKEVIAVIGNDNETVTKNGIDILLNYSPNKKILKDVDGKIYLNDVDEV